MAAVLWEEEKVGHFRRQHYSLHNGLTTPTVVRRQSSLTASFFSPSFLRRQESSDFAFVCRVTVMGFLVRSRDRAACAAGVSTFCRRLSHFSFAGPKEK
ncbi:hypothetical protein [Dyella sp. AtDHG13]|uniref:hypothetical protein n=1 Tax=Dyella sp. AtDHG13 TaxID=1938897 RepID=UPI0011B56614|nr:hypothetical protein [Dyella sp. AtDHG13]